jgi:hypothetical protein
MPKLGVMSGRLHSQGTPHLAGLSGFSRCRDILVDTAASEKDNGGLQQKCVSPGTCQLSLRLVRGPSMNYPNSLEETVYEKPWNCIFDPALNDRPRSVILTG